MQVEIATISQQQTGSQRGWLGQKRLFTGRVGGQDHGGGGIAQQVHRGMEFDGRGLDRFEASGKHLAQAVVDGKGTAVLDDDVAKLAQRPVLWRTRALSASCRR